MTTNENMAMNAMPNADTELPDPPYPTAKNLPGCTWQLSRCWENIEIEPHVVTAAEVRHAIVYGGRMKTAGQIRKQTVLRSVGYWIEVDYSYRPSGRSIDLVSGAVIDAGEAS